jgi:hypothetical protein
MRRSIGRQQGWRPEDDAVLAYRAYGVSGTIYYVRPSAPARVWSPHPDGQGVRVRTLGKEREDLRAA